MSLRNHLGIAEPIWPQASLTVRLPKAQVTSGSNNGDALTVIAHVGLKVMLRGN